MVVLFFYTSHGTLYLYAGNRLFQFMKPYTFKLLLLLILLWTPVYNLSALNGLDELDNQLATLVMESDPGRFAFGYNHWVNQAKASLADADPEELAHWKPHHIQQLWLPDSTMQVFYLFKPWEQNSVEMKWLVRFVYQGKVRVCDFSDQFIVPMVKKAAADSSFELVSSFFVNDNNRLESIALQGGSSGNHYTGCIDLRTLVLFELLHDRSFEGKQDELLKELNDRLMILWSDNELFMRDWSCFKRMITLSTNDKNMRICTYLVPSLGFDSYVKGAVLLREANKINVITLRDRSQEIRAPERSRVSSDKWYGALYTDLIETRYKNKTFYTLLGFKSNDGMVKTRLIDVLTFSGKKAFFGSPQFKQERKTLYRHIFNYSAGANMMLRYDDKMKMIVFDHLAPSEPFFSGQYQYYGPDFSYDGYRFDKGNWFLETDVDLRNPKVR